MSSQKLRITINNLSSRISVRYDGGIFKNRCELFNKIRRSPDLFRLNVEHVCSSAANIRPRLRTIINAYRKAGGKVLNKSCPGKEIDTSLISSPVLNRYIHSRLQQIAKQKRQLVIPPHLGVIARDEGGLQIKNIPEEVLKLRNVLYEFYNVKTTKKYIGKTTQEVGRRFSQHLLKAQKTTEKSTCWQRHLKEHPEQFIVRVTSAASSSLSLGMREFEAIEQADCFKNGLNSNGASAYPKAKGDSKVWSSPAAALTVINQLDSVHKGVDLIPGDVWEQMPISELNEETALAGAEGMQYVHLSPSTVIAVSSLKSSAQRKLGF